MTRAAIQTHDHQSGDRAARLAAVDIGTNSIRLIIADVSHTGAYRIIDDEKVIARLGRGSGVRGRLEPDAIEQAAEVIERMVAIARGFAADRLRLVATAAVRDAENRGVFIDRVRERCGEEVEVISADAEAHLAFRSVTSSFDLTGTDASIADIGGGSTEVVVTVQGIIEHVYTLKLGAVRLKEQFGPCDDPDGAQLMAVRNAVREVIREQVDRPANASQVLIGTGGTFSALAAISLARVSAGRRVSLSPGELRGHEIQRDEVRHITEWLRRLPLDERARVPGLSPDRADIIVPGLVIADRLMKRLGVNRLRVHDRGIRDGIILEMIQAMGLPSEGRERRGLGVDPSGSALEFAARCGVNPVSARHTAMLAASIADQLVALGLLTLDARGRVMLEHAALLRDVGYLVNYSKHHKHSYHLIVNADLEGLSHRERILVATVARYHRKSAPSLSHEEFAPLAPDDRELVARLAAILRVADGLDRTHAQEVSAVTITRGQGSLAFACAAERDPAACIWGAESRAEMFESIFGLRCTFSWTRPAHSTTGAHTP
jgi:exopolyphosphatase/guanosine-5'-triphosphate,3'-diphosphate pyrophosphatase